MAIITTSTSGKTLHGVVSMYIETENELSQINVNSISDGSTVCVIENANVYILVNKQWKLLGGE